MNINFAYRTSVLILAGTVGIAAMGVASADGIARGKWVHGENGTYSSGQRVYSRTNGVSGSSRYSAYSNESGAGSWSRKKTLIDEQGNAYHRNTKGFRGPNGTSGYRVKEQVHNADGSAVQYKTRQVDGANGGSFNANSTLQRTADGEVSGSRTVTAQGASGKTYQSEMQMVDGKWTGSATCTDASGATVECR